MLMGGGTRRDNFPEGVKRQLCDRVGGLCSKPDCRINTKGPRADSNGAKSIGRAAHIHGAARKGPRYDESQTREQRRSFENGIWLCANHAAEVDDDKSRFSADELRKWKNDAEAYAEAAFGKRTVVAGVAAVEGLVSIGPDVIASGRVLRTAGQTWVVGIDHFLVGDLSSLRRFADSFAAAAPEDCCVCVEADGVGRMLVDPPETDLTDGIRVTLHVAAPLPVREAKEKFDANRLGTDIGFDLSGDEPDLPPIWPLISGADRIPQKLMMHLGTCKGGWSIGAETGSRVGELYHRLPAQHLAGIIAVETIRLATVPVWDSWLKDSFVPLSFVERVVGVRLLPTSSEEFLKVGITLDVYGLPPGKEFVVPISTSIESLGPRPPPPSASISLRGTNTDD